MKYKFFDQGFTGDLVLNRDVFPSCAATSEEALRETLCVGAGRNFRLACEELVMDINERGFNPQEFQFPQASGTVKYLASWFSRVFRDCHAVVSKKERMVGQDDRRYWVMLSIVM